jgi:16S rRNA (guanine527-N7)-methyltransferase
VGILVRDPLLAAEAIPTGRLIDVGSGNGSPGLVLAILRPDLRTTLLEPRLKRWTFLREATRVLGRSDIEVLRMRHEGYCGPPAETVTLRALALPLPALAPLLVPGGTLLVFGGAPREAPPFRSRSPRRLATLVLHTFERGCFT